MANKSLHLAALTILGLLAVMSSINPATSQPVSPQSLPACMDDCDHNYHHCRDGCYAAAKEMEGISCFMSCANSAATCYKNCAALTVW